MKQNFLSMMKHSMMAICTVVAAGMITASLTACSSSEDESEKEAAKVKEYLAGNEWTINSTSGTTVSSMLLEGENFLGTSNDIISFLAALAAQTLRATLFR
jgi:ABC-type oligopeptide transport system substrate-binding subunit